MPTLTCPHCRTPQSISDEIFQRNIGKKCRCRQCQQIFVLESTPPEQESGGDFDWLKDDSPVTPAPAQPSPAATKAKAPHQKAPVQATTVPAPSTASGMTSSPSGSDPDFASLLGGETAPSSADFRDLTPDETTVVVPPQSETSATDVSFPGLSLDETLSETPPLAEIQFDAPQDEPTKPEARTDAQGHKKSATRASSGELLIHPDRIALLVVIIRWIGWGTLGLLGIRVLFGLWAVTRHPSMDAKVMGVLGELATAVISAGGVIVWFLLAELIPLFVSMEASLREISARKEPPQS